MTLTDKQKKAIMVLMDLFTSDHINEEKYFLLMEFIIGGNEPQISYIPSNPIPDFYPVFGKFGEVTCNQKVEE